MFPFRLTRRPWRLFLVLVLCAAGMGLAGVQIWAWHHWRGAQAELQRFHGARASAHLAACLRVWPSSVSVHLLAARAAREAGSYDEAERQLQECQRLQEGPSPEIALEWALLHASQGQLDVEEYLQDRAAKDPGAAPLVRDALAEGYVRMYRVFDAFARLDRWLRERPDDPRALFLHGQTWQQLGAVRQAVPDYRRAVELDPDQDEARRRLAADLLEIGRFDEALTHLEYLRQRQPGDAELLVQLARCHNGTGRAAEARQILQGVLAEHPGCGLALRTLGEIALQDQQPAEAEQWLRQAAEALPHDYQAQWSLYLVLRQLGKDDEAKAQLARAQRLKDLRDRLGEVSHRLLPARPNDPALRCEMGTLLLELGHDDFAERWLLIALNSDPNYRPAHAALADFYERKGDADRAAEHRRAAEGKGRSDS